MCSLCRRGPHHEAFCQSPHWSMKCSAYASISQRLRRARDLQLCFVCLREGHHTTSCPTDAKTCKFCSSGSHHRALCRNDVSNHNRATTKSNGTRAVGKKRVKIAGVRVNNRNVCPTENETICFCDVSTFHQFGRQLRPGVQMIVTPRPTSADATNLVCGYRPTMEVKRVIFWFSIDRASLSHVELVRLVTELSQYYTTHYETIMQSVVVSPSVSSRQDAWTYGIFKYLVQAEVLLLDARAAMLPHAILVHDANQHQATDTEHRSEAGNLLNSTEDIKNCLRVQHQLDLWSHYCADHQLRTLPATSAAHHPATATHNVHDDAAPAKDEAYSADSEVAAEHRPTPIVARNVFATSAANLTKPELVKVTAYSAVTETPSTSSQTEAAAYSATAKVPAPLPNSATIADQIHCVQDVDAATASGAGDQPPIPPTAPTSSATDAHAIAAPAASLHRQRGHSDRHESRRDQGPALQAHGLYNRTESFAAIAEQGP